MEEKKHGRNSLKLQFSTHLDLATKQKQANLVISTVKCIISNQGTQLVVMPITVLQKLTKGKQLLVVLIQLYDLICLNMFQLLFTE